MGTLSAETGELGELARDLEGRAGAIRQLARQVGAVSQAVGAAGGDGYELSLAGSRTAHAANRLQDQVPVLRQLAAWLAEVDQTGAWGSSLAAVAPLGIAGFATGGSPDALRSTLESLVGRPVFARPGEASGALPPSGDGPGRTAGYTGAWGSKRDDSYRPGAYSSYQCTAWANFRWRELNYTGPVLSGNGWEVAKKAGNTSATPSVGALASYPSGDYGHVMVVESVELGADGSPVAMTVSDGNGGANPWVGTADEWGATHRWVRRGSGWGPEGARSVQQVTFAAFRTS